MLVEHPHHLASVLVPQPLDEGVHQRLYALIRAGIAHGVEVLHLQGGEPGRVGRAVHRAVGPAGKGRGGRRRQGLRRAEAHKVVGFQVCRAAGGRHGLAVHLLFLQIGHHVHLLLVVGVGLHSRPEAVAPGAAPPGGDRHAPHRGAGLGSAGVHPVHQQGRAPLQRLPDEQQLRRRGVMAEHLQGRLVELPGLQGIDLALRPPVQLQGQGRRAPLSQRGGGGRAHEIDVAAGQDLVLHRKGAASHRHSVHLSFQPCAWPLV